MKLISSAIYNYHILSICALTGQLRAEVHKIIVKFAFFFFLPFWFIFLTIGQLFRLKMTNNEKKELKKAKLGNPSGILPAFGSQLPKAKSTIFHMCFSNF